MQHVIVFGALAGAVTIGSAILAVSLVGGTHVAGLEWLGYLVMILALSLEFVGIKRYRDQELGGVIRFGTAALVGLGIALVASAIYVAAWEGYLAATDYAFIDEYFRAEISALRESSVSDADLQAEVEAMNRLRDQYANPLFRLPITFLEIFPVGVLIALASAGLLRRSELLPAAGRSNVASYSSSS